VLAQFIDAGHILGSAAVRLDIEEKNGSNGFRKYSFLFSGDIGRRDLPIIRDPILPWDVDYLMMETTYGNKPHRSPEEAYQELRDVVRRTIARRGKIIIPAFAVGRTQELVYDFHLMMQNGEIPSIPIYVDSPLLLTP
jgi:metallo-beta-lactamase family protein